MINKLMIKYSKQIGGLQVVATSPINIALVKYWGKVDEDYIIPCNSSLSITIDQKNLCSRTVITLLEQPEKNEQDEDKTIELILNGKKEKITDRIMKIIRLLRDRTEGVTAVNLDNNNEPISFTRD